MLRFATLAHKKRIWRIGIGVLFYYHHSSYTRCERAPARGFCVGWRRRQQRGTGKHAFVHLYVFTIRRIRVYSRVCFLEKYGSAMYATSGRTMCGMNIRTWNPRVIQMRGQSQEPKRNIYIDIYVGNPKNQTNNTQKRTQYMYVCKRILTWWTLALVRVSIGLATRAAVLARWWLAWYVLWFAIRSGVAGFAHTSREN